MSITVQTAVLDTIENFLDTCPTMEHADVHFNPERAVGENPGVLMMEFEAGGSKYLVVVKRVGS